MRGVSAGEYPDAEGDEEEPAGAGSVLEFSG